MSEYCLSSGRSHTSLESLPLQRNIYVNLSSSIFYSLAPLSKYVHNDGLYYYYYYFWTTQLSAVLCCVV